MSGRCIDTKKQCCGCKRWTISLTLPECNAGHEGAASNGAAAMDVFLHKSKKRKGTAVLEGLDGDPLKKKKGGKQ